MRRIRRRFVLVGLVIFIGFVAGFRFWSASAQSPNKNLWKSFSGERAFQFTKAIVDFGPRFSGSEALNKTRSYIENTLSTHGWQTERQAFIWQTPVGPIAFVNLIARPKGIAQTAPKFIICTHYDTKRFDQFQFVGANDGASGTGALLELARVLSLEPKWAKNFELVFFDGEEAIKEWTSTDSLYGSRYYAQELLKTGRAKQFQYGILWDMIGQKKLSITLPLDSPTHLVKKLFTAADAIGTRSYFTYFRGNLGDDHQPLNQIGIPTIDMIDFNYPAWHTKDDTLDQLSPNSLEIVGRTTLYALLLK